MQFYGASRYHYYVNAALTLTRVRSRSRTIPHYRHRRDRALNRAVGKVRRACRGPAGSNFCDIAAAAPLRSRLEASLLADSVDSLSSQPRLVSKRLSAMILDEDLYPPRHKTVIKYRYVAPLVNSRVHGAQWGSNETSRFKEDYSSKFQYFIRV